MNDTSAPKLQRFIIFICPDENFKAPENLESEVIQWVEDTMKRGAYVLGSRFRPMAEAKSVQVTDGNVSVTDLSIKDNPSRIAGCDILQCKNIEEAIEIASQHPMAKHGSIQIRPFWE